MQYEAKSFLSGSFFFAQSLPQKSEDVEKLNVSAQEGTLARVLRAILSCLIAAIGF